ncbi:hypothetical protein M758_4G013000 [Ceratodon purpureus]|uniref:Uncharacterized protein n=1 Tax=Ceratodon purpureus TaxID=3225 RepID=A0A8T0I6J7_CERPU|nr:hypothetical protein KC19_4G014200 [Ceratodon purpureus]KAG0617758.1 hypothetical protein M758_4G013000 [Ceratodon purpureus]
MVCARSARQYPSMAGVVILIKYSQCAVFFYQAQLPAARLLAATAPLVQVLATAPTIPTKSLPMSFTTAFVTSPLRCPCFLSLSPIFCTSARVT